MTQLSDEWRQSSLCALRRSRARLRLARWRRPWLSGPSRLLRSGKCGGIAGATAAEVAANFGAVVDVIAGAASDRVRIEMRAVLPRKSKVEAGAGVEVFAGLRGFPLAEDRSVAARLRRSRVRWRDCKSGLGVR